MSQDMRQKGKITCVFLEFDQHFPTFICSSIAVFYTVQRIEVIPTLMYNERECLSPHSVIRLRSLAGEKILSVLQSASASHL